MDPNELLKPQFRLHTHKKALAFISHKPSLHCLGSPSCVIKLEKLDLVYITLCGTKSLEKIDPMTIADENTEIFHLI